MSQSTTKMTQRRRRRHTTSLTTISTIIFTLIILALTKYPAAVSSFSYTNHAIHDNRRQYQKRIKSSRIRMYHHHHQWKFSNINNNNNYKNKKKNNNIAGLSFTNNNNECTTTTNTSQGRNRQFLETTLPSSKIIIPWSSSKQRQQRLRTTIKTNNPRIRRRRQHDTLSMISSLLLSLLLILPLTTPMAFADTTTQPSPNNNNINMRYWDAIQSQNPSLIMNANEKLIDHAIGTINTMYYDNTGGWKFDPKEMYGNWRVLKSVSVERKDATVARKELSGYAKDLGLPQQPPLSGGEGSGNLLESREGVVESLKWIVSTLDDPYSKYLTRDELRNELTTKDDGFLGLGAIVQTPRAPRTTTTATTTTSQTTNPLIITPKKKKTTDSSSTTPTTTNNNNILTVTRAANLPLITAIVPHSPAERGGLVVGDRIVAVGSNNFLGWNRDAVENVLSKRYHAENYAGLADLIVAKPLYYEDLMEDDDEMMESAATAGGGSHSGRMKIVGYRMSHVKITTDSINENPPWMMTATPTNTNTNNLTTENDNNNSNKRLKLSGGNNICHWELLTPSDFLFAAIDSPQSDRQELVGYIRITRFSKAATAGYIDAIHELESLGAKRFIVDVRNNYGGVIQEAMLTASTLLRDPSSVLCYTLNSRGGFTPHDAEEFIVDKRYPGYFLSSESPSVSLDDVKRNNPTIFTDGWTPPSSYASLHEQSVKRHYNTRVSSLLSPTFVNNNNNNPTKSKQQHQYPLVILMNEGTASSAEVFVSSLHDNGRTAALVGAKTYGKGLIQHTFPMPDGGGLRLTVAEYLTPALKHVTKIGEATFDQRTGERIGGGLTPDIYCESTGIPSHPGGDICVGLAWDALQEVEPQQDDDNDVMIDGCSGGSVLRKGLL